MPAKDPPAALPSPDMFCHVERFLPRQLKSEASDGVVVMTNGVLASDYPTQLAQGISGLRSIFVSQVPKEGSPQRNLRLDKDYVDKPTAPRMCLLSALSIRIRNPIHKGCRMSFLDLPYEIRFAIYDATADNVDYPAGQSAHAILLTCRQIYMEAKALLYRKAPYDIVIADQSIAMRGRRDRSLKKRFDIFPSYFDQLGYLRIRLQLKLNDIQSAWDDRRDWLGYQGDHYNDRIPYDGYLSHQEEWELSKSRVRDHTRSQLRRVCSAVLEGQNKLQTLTVIVEDENPQFTVDDRLLLNPLAMLNNVPNVNIQVPGKDFSYLEKAVRGPVPGLLQLPPQIRRRILRLLLTDQAQDRDLQEIPHFRPKQLERHGLLLVNHKICDEAKTILYEETLFGFIVSCGEIKCSLSKKELRWGDLEYLHADRFHMITKLWVKICLRVSTADYPQLGMGVDYFLDQSNRELQSMANFVEELCESIAVRPPLKLLRVYIVDVPLFRGPRRPNFTAVEPFLLLHNIPIARFEGDIDRKTALEMMRLVESRPSEFRLYCRREDLKERQEMLRGKWATWLQRYRGGYQSTGNQR